MQKKNLKEILEFGIFQFN